MKILLVGLQKKALAQFIRDRYAGIEIVDTDPDVIVAYGGDGTLLYAEREYPHLPKTLIRNSQVCDNCAVIAKTTTIELLQDQHYTVQEYNKLEVKSNDVTLIALNDVMVGHPRVNSTLRSKLLINGEQYGDEILGDGVVISTPIGSTGYYQSITHSNFQSGLGIAFNNTVNIINHLVVNEDALLCIDVTRGPGVVAVDNDEQTISLSTGDTVQVRTADQMAQLISFPQEYKRFNITMNSNRVPLGFCQICQQHYAE